jgi:hypothetical protein
LGAVMLNYATCPVVSEVLFVRKSELFGNKSHNRFGNFVRLTGKPAFVLEKFEHDSETELIRSSCIPFGGQHLLFMGQQRKMLN